MTDDPSTSPTPPPTPSPGKAGALSTVVLNSFLEAAPHRQAWNEIVERTGADIYQTYEWCSTWWKYYGGGRDLSLLFAYRDGSLVGIVPAFSESLWLGPVRIRAAKLVGSDYSLTLCNLAVLPGELEEMAVCALDLFLKEKGCDLLLLGPLSGPAARIESVLSAARHRPELLAAARTLGDSCNSFFSLPGSFDEYLKGLDKKQRSNFKRMIEQSAKGRTVTFETISDTEGVIHEYERFLNQHESQWKADNKLGHFGDWPRASDFNRDLVRTFSSEGCVRFYRILSDGVVVSSQYCFVRGRTVYWRLPARVRSPEWDRFSLGTIGLVKMIESMLSENLSTIEGGRGHYGYKVLHGAREWDLRTVCFERRGRWVSVRLLLFRLLSRTLNLLYYKIVFVRLAPRFSPIRRPLWHTWIKSTW